MRTDPLEILDGFFATWRFPIFAWSLVVGYEVLLCLLLFFPMGGSQDASFADEFRIWCFGYDPATGETQWASVLTTFTSPLVLLGVLTLVWFDPMKKILWDHPKATIPYIATAGSIVLTSAICLTSMDFEPNRGELPFPARALRTKNTPPDFVLTNQDGQRVALADYRGKVVILTAVYSTCGFTCPMIMGQAKRIVAELREEDRRDFAVIGVTLDPEKDTPQQLALMAEGQDVHAPLFNLCTGEPEYVEGILDELEVHRTRDPVTGVIDHANLFLLVDRSGHIAYRLTLGERQERWLASAVRLLLAEKGTE